MQLEDALPYLRCGYGIYRSGWLGYNGCRLFMDGQQIEMDTSNATDEAKWLKSPVKGFQLSSTEILAEDWKVDMDSKRRAQ